LGEILKTLHNRQNITNLYKWNTTGLNAAELFLAVLDLKDIQGITAMYNFTSLYIHITIMINI
jgi:hypothetical protein